MPSNLSADERAAVEKVRDALDRKDLSDKELVVFDDEPLYPGSLFKPGEPVTYGDLRTLLAVVARDRGDASADTRRLNWLDKRGRYEPVREGYCDDSYVWRVEGRGKYLRSGYDGTQEPHSTLRAAIDHAMTAAPAAPEDK
jgi:hypothetical protein